MNFMGYSITVAMIGRIIISELLEGSTAEPPERVMVRVT
jgi:hypothetical protein